MCRNSAVLGVVHGLLGPAQHTHTALFMSDPAFTYITRTVFRIQRWKFCSMAGGRAVGHMLADISNVTCQQYF